MIEQIDYQTYWAKHRSGGSLRQALNDKSPIRFDGKVFHGYTKWHIEWYLRWWQESDGRCRISDNKTRLFAEITLPSLTTRDKQAKAEFNRYLNALRTHELGHVEIGRDYAEQIDQAILSLPEMASCSALEAAANRLGRQLIEQAIRAEKEMDRITAYGSTQGALLAH